MKVLVSYNELNDLYFNLNGKVTDKEISFKGLLDYTLRGSIKLRLGKLNKAVLKELQEIEEQRIGILKIAKTAVGVLETAESGTEQPYSEEVLAEANKMFIELVGEKGDKQDFELDVPSIDMDKLLTDGDGKDLTFDSRIDFSIFEKFSENV
jgi:hypothetical protein